MLTQLVRHRKSAYITQSGRCFYCDCLMWENNPESFAKSNNISPPQAKWLKCTAEHLEARKDGGKDAAKNIVAACLWCNRKRHSRKLDLSPQAFQLLVKQRVRKGRWHCKAVIISLLHKGQGGYVLSQCQTPT
jgi:HNH endonuclease